MKHYSEFKKEINGIKSVTSILKSIEKVSAANVKIIKKKIANLEAYTSNIYFILKRLSLFYKNKDNILINKKEEGFRILLVITGEKGLVGALWQKIIDEVKTIKNQYDKILVVGKKGFEKLNNEKIITELFFNFKDELEIEQNIKLLSKQILNKFKEKNTKSIDILYAYPQSLSEQKIMIKKFLPFIFLHDEKIVEESLGFPIFDSPKKIIFENLIEKYIETLFYKIILNSKLSENSSKTLEMEHAKEKSNATIKNVKKNFLRNKRKKINQAQLEIISVRTKR